MISNELENLKHQTHSLKGVLLNFEAEKINNLSIELDKNALEGNIEHLKIVLDKIKDISDDYISEINHFKKTL